MSFTPDTSHEPEFTDLRPLFLKIIRNSWFILGVAFLAGVVALAVLQASPNTYEASASIMLNPNRDAADQSDTLIGLVRTKDIAEAVIASLGDELPQDLKDVANLLDAVEGTSGSGDLVLITVTTEDPTSASLIANTWAEEYVARTNSIYLPAEADTSLSSQALADYTTAQEALAGFIAQNRIDELQRLINEKQSLIDSLQASRQSVLQQQVNAETKSLSDSYVAAQRLEYLLSDVNSLLTQVEQGSGVGDSANGLSLLLLKVEAYASLGGTSVNSDTTSLLPMDLQLQLTDPTMVTTDPEVQIVELQAMQSILTARLTVVSEEIASQSALLLSNQVLSLADDEDGAVITELEDQVRTLTAQLEEESATQRELTAARDSAWDFYQTVKKQQETLTISADFSEDMVSIASLAPSEAAPQSSGTLSKILLAAVVGLLLAVGAVWLADYLYPDFEFASLLHRRKRAS